MQFDEHFGQLRNANFQGWCRNRNFQVPKFFGDRPEIRRRLTGDSSEFVEAVLPVFRFIALDAPEGIIVVVVVDGCRHNEDGSTLLAQISKV